MSAVLTYSDKYSSSFMSAVLTFLDNHISTSMSAVLTACTHSHTHMTVNWFNTLPPAASSAPHVSVSPPVSLLSPVELAPVAPDAAATNTNHTCDYQCTSA